MRISGRNEKIKERYKQTEEESSDYILNRLVKEKNIKLFILPPRSPKLNGGVERVNQTWQDEFYLLKYMNCLMIKIF
jgi:hypothetical protein